MKIKILKCFALEKCTTVAFSTSALINEVIGLLNLIYVKSDI